jgi:hypothetical protein
MNIFFLSLDPETCAKMYCDQHVIKILLEIVQMLYTAWHFSGVSNWNDRAPLTKAGAKGYRVAHPNHPMCLWVRSSEEAYNYTVTLGLALAIEYNARFHKIHACSSHIMWLKKNVPPCLRSSISQKAYYSVQGIPECMPEEHWNPDIIKAYQSYYKTKTFARWSRSFTDIS